jgi:hypothetical protein
MNIRLHYLYRDAHNYKQHSSVVFNNPMNRSLESIENEIHKWLIEGQWFEHKNWGVPDLHFQHFNLETDHFWHEYEAIELTNDSSELSIEDFLNRIRTL